MSGDRWQALSDWHDAWLAASPEDRSRLRDEFVETRPDLATDADGLVAVGADLRGFLETPAFVLSGPALAEEEPSLDPATLVGPYRIGALLARGGMGDVYRATDVRLGRDVALKVLAHASTSDPQRVERFMQEARATASLDHPNIVRLYDVGVVADRPYLVTELLDGETLRTRIARGPLAPEEAARIAAEVAGGLAAAHAAGLVHRDLKPENVFLTRAGGAKILDFGIAKLAEDASAHDGLSTLTGMLLGTAGYLTPEQIRGDAVDGRADLFALGSILFEMLTGRRAFARQHTIDTLYAILHEPAPDLIDVRPDAPPALAAIVTRLLEKTAGARYASAAELLDALARADTAEASGLLRPRHKPRRPRRRRWLGRVAAAAVIVPGFVWTGWWIGQRPAADAAAPPLTRLEWTLPDGLALGSPPAVSPDGRLVAFSGIETGGRRLFVRRLDSPEAAPIPGTDDANHPFWAPDSQAIGFFARGKLKRVAVSGGAPVEIADAPDGRGGTWSTTGAIVFGPHLIDAPLLKVPAIGGTPEPATIIDRSHGENSHRWPAFLPDGVHFLYFIRSSVDDRRGVYLGRIDRPPAAADQPLVRTESDAVYVPLADGHGGVILSVAGRRLEARLFDATTFSLRGDPRAIDLPAAGQTPYHAAMLSASPDVLAFVAASLPYGTSLESVDRSGGGRRSWPERAPQNWPRVSPDGRWLAWQRIDVLRGDPDIWAEDLERGTRVLVSTGPEDDALPVWSPDGRRIAYEVGQRSAPRLRVAAADGTGLVREIPCPRPRCVLTDWSPDGRFLVVNVLEEGGGGDVWLVAADADEPPRAVLTDRFVERDGRISPDGRWIAYVSEESGRAEVSIRDFQGARRYVISASGGDQPVWRRDGRELYFVDAKGALHAVRVDPRADGALVFGQAVALDVPHIGAEHLGTQYDVSPDGRRVYFLDRRLPAPPRQIEFVLGWRGLLR